MRIGRRLKKVLDLVDSGPSVVVDVGTDHGYLALKILEEKQAYKVYATDISEPSLKKAVLLKERYNLGDRLECLVGDGFLPIKHLTCVDIGIIAGMGGNEIVKILSETENKERFGYFILQPMQDADILREYLLSAGYFISHDETVKDRDKFYSTIRCVYNGKPCEYDKKDIFIGKTDYIERGEDFLLLIKSEVSFLESKKQYLDKLKREKLEILKNILLESEEKNK